MSGVVAKSLVFLILLRCCVLLLTTWADQSSRVLRLTLVDRLAHRRALTEGAVALAGKGTGWCLQLMMTWADVANGVHEATDAIV